MKKIILIVVFSVLSFTLFSADMVDKVNSQIISTYINNGGLYLIKISNYTATNRDDNWLTLGQVGDPIADALYATALSAKLANADNLWIRFWVSGTDRPKVGIICIN